MIRLAMPRFARPGTRVAPKSIEYGRIGIGGGIITDYGWRPRLQDASALRIDARESTAAGHTIHTGAEPRIAPSPPSCPSTRLTERAGHLTACEASRRVFTIAPQVGQFAQVTAFFFRRFLPNHWVGDTGGSIVVGASVDTVFGRGKIRTTTGFSSLWPHRRQCRGPVAINWRRPQYEQATIRRTGLAARQQPQ
jgi:hypothetical protein